MRHVVFFFSSRRRHTRFDCDWSSDVCSSDLNRCSLQSAELLSYPPAQRLQGSCCTAMDPARYRDQVAWLRRYVAIRQIPADPYDIPAGLARQLIGYQATIRLSSAQQETYRAAMRQAPEKGPCCCHCWRGAALPGP